MRRNLNQSMNMIRDIRSSSVVWLLCGILLGCDAYGLGIRQPEQGAAATAQNDAFTAQADNPSAIYYNPAGLLQITGTETLVGATVYGPEATYKGKGDGAGASKGTQDDIFVLPHFYAVSDFGIQWFRAGLGVYTPFGQSVDWGNNNSFRYVTTRSELEMVNINPTIAVRVTSNLFFGVGYDFYYCDADVRRAFPFVVFAPGPVFLGEGNVRFTGHGEGHGFNVGGMWKLHEQHTVGAAYRSGVDVEFEGHAKISDTPPLPGFPKKIKEHARAEFNFPDIVQIGYAFWPTPRWKIEVDGDWTHWDVTNKQALKSQGLKALGVPKSLLTTKLNWEDSWIVMLGTQYEVKNGVFLRGGWYFSENSVPEKNFIPTVADNDRVGVSAGLGFKRKNWSLDVAYQFNITLDRSVKNNVGSDPFPPISQSVDGDYESYSQGGAISVGFHF